jgi:hypothetical protein
MSILTGYAKPAPCSSSFRRVHVHVHVRGAHGVAAGSLWPRPAGELGLAPSALLSCPALCLICVASVPCQWLAVSHAVVNTALETLSSGLLFAETHPHGVQELLVGTYCLPSSSSVSEPEGCSHLCVVLFFALRRRQMSIRFSE